MTDKAANELAALGATLPATTAEALKTVNAVEEKMRQMPQFEPRMEHMLHAGMYARTARVNRGDAFTSVMIKVPTILIINGWAWVFAGDRWHEVKGYKVIAASAMRKVVYVIERPTEITMLFPSRAKTVEEAEKGFTDEYERLLTKQQGENDLVTITRGEECQG